MQLLYVSVKGIISGNAAANRFLHVHDAIVPEVCTSASRESKIFACQSATRPFRQPPCAEFVLVGVPNGPAWRQHVSRALDQNLKRTGSPTWRSTSRWSSCVTSPMMRTPRPGPGKGCRATKDSGTPIAGSRPSARTSSCMHRTRSHVLLCVFRKETSGDIWRKQLVALMRSLAAACTISLLPQARCCAASAGNVDAHDRSCLAAIG